jgi:hypothetical protein
MEACTSLPVRMVKGHQSPCRQAARPPFLSINPMMSRTMVACATHVSHPDLMTNPDTSHMCARIKLHTYDDSVYRNKCHKLK